jgi:hypothetical protein
MTDLRTSTPPAAETLAALIQRQRREWSARDGDAPDADETERAWLKTWRQVARSPVVTSADAIAALSVIAEHMDVSGCLDGDFGAYPKLFKALRGYIKSTAEVQ